LVTTGDNDERASESAYTVCVPMYDNGTTIERCLRSVLDQDGVEFEIVVVDDDSSDDCVAIAAGLLRPRDRLIRNESRHNRCVELAGGTCRPVRPR
jgi:glycosyltransferase involved in cell wall biosynthesis